MTLHTLNQGPANRSGLESCQRALQAGDTLLLIEDGVYWSLPGLPCGLELPPQVQLCALEADLQARGIASLAQPVDDAGFVDLCLCHERIVSWF